MIPTGSLPKTAIAQLKLQFWKKKLMGFVNHTFRNDYDKVVGGREQAESFHKCLAKDYYGVQFEEKKSNMPDKDLSFLICGPQSSENVSE